MKTEEMVRLAEQGFSRKEIGERAGCSAMTVSAKLIEAGQRVLPFKPRRTNRLDEARAHSLYQIGCNDVEIALACDVNTYTVLKWRHASGLAKNATRKSVRRRHASRQRMAR